MPRLFHPDRDIKAQNEACGEPRDRISAALTALGGAIHGQYLMYLTPETVSGVVVSLQIVFAAIVGGMYAALGPTVGGVDDLAE